MSHSKAAVDVEAFKTLKSISEIARFFGTSRQRLFFHLYSTKRPTYRVFSIPKASGGKRTIAAPPAVISIFQRQLLECVGAMFFPKYTTHGFTRGRSVITNAKPHVRARLLLNLDLLDFFPNMHFGRVRGVFMHHPFSFSHEVATILAQICCYQGSLPQGAPTSPIMANLICRGLDRELARFCRKLHCKYTRYADDITISTLATGFDSDIVISLPEAEKNSPVIGVGLAAVIEKHDLKINPTKTRVRTYMERQEVTGLVVNVRLNVRRKFVRNLRATIDNANRYGMLVANTRFQARFDTKTRRGSSPPLIDHLNGKLDYLRMVRGADDPLYTRYAISANKLSFNRPYGVAVWGRAAKQERLLAEAVWMLLGSNSQGVQVTQGTAFSLARVGVITAAHVLNDSSVTSWAIVKASDPTIEIPITEGRIHNHLDIAILTCLCNQSASLRIRPETVTQGEAATIVGFPDWNSPGDRLFIGNSHVVQLKIVSGVSYLLTGTTLRSGISGGPILDEAGLVMGVALAGESNPIAPNGGVAATHIEVVKNLPIVPLPT